MNKVLVTISIVEYIILILILVINMHKHSKILKYLSLILFIIAILSINLYNKMIIDDILYQAILYLYFPSYNVYVVTIILSLLMLIYSIVNDKIERKTRIINFIFSSLLILSYILFLLLKINVNSYKLLYSRKSLILLRYATRSFSVWLVFTLIVKYYKLILYKR